MSGMSRAPRVLGLMSGTSADGIDAVLLELDGWPAVGAGGALPALEGPAPRGRVVAHTHHPYEDALRTEVLRAARGEARTPELAQLHFALGDALAEAARDLARDADLVASHGQTVWHLPRPEAGPRATLQLGEAAVIAEVTRRDVVSDFRPADLAAGGEAAPLVPFADRVLFAERGVRRAVHNLGGISNLTYLPGLDAAGVLAFDTGPANCLSDEAAALVGA
ncbi:anhydro-N-acetylmuramic acid kinase, partial [Deinococcus pimensis]|uniref:anhydro-N-acetylmuramic acid kinase n=1 Tax=Deinococcus pimensis TaxID=309888 RepID=UPI00316AD27D